MENKSIVVELKARDRIELIVQADGTEKIQAIACSSCLELLRSLQNRNLKVRDWPLPQGTSHSALLIKELILKAQGNWNYPIIAEDLAAHELCHCRAISAEYVDQAIIAGAHSMEQLREATSASTGCGTCWEEITKIIEFRLN